jgi:hypothetical protein
MTDSQGGEAAIVETNAGASGAPVSSERDYETEAREGGWRPQEEWTGKPDKWKDAKTWVENSDLPTRIRNEVKAELEAVYEGRFANLEKMSRHSQKIISDGYEAQIAGLKEKKVAAVKAGDVAAVEKIDQAIDQTKEAAKEGGESPIEADVNKAFQKKNPWYGDDDELTAMAIVQSNAIVQAYGLKHGKPMPNADMLEAVERKVKASPEYKAKFGDKAANAHAAVDGGSDDPAPGPRTDSLFGKLPPEAKKQCASDVKAGLYKSNDEWAKVYFS